MKNLDIYSVSAVGEKLRFQASLTTLGNVQMMSRAGNRTSGVMIEVGC